MDIGSWVPQFFYDLIGRLVPGGMFVGTALVIFPGTATFVRESGVLKIGDEESATLVILAVIVVAYISGAVLGGVGYLFSALMRKLQDFAKAIWVRLKKGFGSSSKGNDSPVKEKGETYSYKYDFIHFHYPRAGARLAKIGAERHMCRVVMVGAVVLLISLPLATPGPAIEVARAAVMIGFLGGWALNRHLDRRGGRGLRNNWRLINEALKAKREEGQLEHKAFK